MFKVDVVEGDIARYVMARRLLGKNLYRAACYLTDGLLVDTGIPLLCGKIDKALSGRPLSAIVNTHAHEDHMGANAVLQKGRRVPIYAHEKALPVLSDPGKLSLLPYQKLFFGEPAPSTGKPIGHSIRTERHTFKVIRSPGHSSDHVALYEESKGWLFSGDAFIGGNDRVFREGYDILEMTKTLRKLASLGAGVMFTGMGNVVRNPVKQIERKLSYFEETSRRIGRLHREGMATSEIAKRLFPGDFTVRLVTLGDFTAVKLVQSFLRASGEI